MIQPADLTRHFHSKIPVSQALGLQVVEISDQHALLTAPLAPNLNHVHTAFGGSLYAAAALSCYALFQAIAASVGGFSDELVIQEGRIQYIAPVTKDFQIEARLQSPDQARQFVEALRRHGKARLELSAEIREQGGNVVAARFTGMYVYRGTKLPTTTFGAQEGSST